MSNPFEETAFETSVYHYFLFKANQATTAAAAAAREATQKKLDVGSPLNILATTAVNDKSNDDAKDPPTDKSPEQQDTGKAASPTTQNSPPKPPAAQLPDAESIAKIMSAKYNRLVAAMKQDFPQYASMVPQNAPWLLPDVSMRYTHFPQVHNEEAGFLRQRVFVLEQQLQQQRAENQHLQKALDAKYQGSPAPAPRKRGRPPKDEERPRKRRSYKRICNRPDVPDDVKAEVAQLKKEVAAEKRNMRNKIARLENKVSRKEELVQMLARVPTTVKKPPPSPPPVQVPTAASVPSPSGTATPAAALPAPTKPPPSKQQVEPPPTFENRFKELQDYHRANNTCRVPSKIPGLGRWCTELRRNYKMAMERPETLQGKLTGASAELTQERIDRLNELNFEWEVATKAVPWEVRFNEIVEYKEKHGNTLVPRNWKENPSLGEW